MLKAVRAMLAAKHFTSTVKIVGNLKIQIDKTKAVYYKTVAAQHKIDLIAEDPEDEDDNGDHSGDLLNL